MPGGTTSNIFTYFSKGVLALSIMMTTVSTLVAVVAVPLLLQFYGGLAGLSGDYVIRRKRGASAGGAPGANSPGHVPAQVECQYRGDN